MMDDSFAASRFLCFASHLFLSLVVFSSRAMLILRSLPLRYTIQQYNIKDGSITLALSLTWICMLIQAGTFLSGLTVFQSTWNLYLTLSHGLATMILAVMVSDGWKSDTYWSIFLVFSGFPTVLEILIATRIAVFRKGYL